MHRRALTLCALAALVLLASAVPASAQFGLLPGKAGFDVTATNADGTPDLQAGSHPFALTTTIRFKTTTENGEPVPDGNVKDIRVELPPGLVGNATAVPQCSQRQFFTPPVSNGDLTSSNSTNCPAATAVGVETVEVFESSEIAAPFKVNIYNLVPPPGMPAEFGFSFTDVPVVLVPSVRGGRDYGISVESRNTSQALPILSATTTFWGVPADPRHDTERGRECLNGFNLTGRTCPAGSPEVPLLTLPTSCGAPLQYRVSADSWQESGAPVTAAVESEDGEGNPTGLDGCNQLPFEPSISLAPDGQAASAPTGLVVGVHVPQETLLNPAGLSEADVRNTTVTLPEGMALNPAAADGLLACSTEQAGYEGREAGSGELLFSPGPTACPEDSKIGTVQIKTPLLAESLEGAVYLAAQNANPFGSLVAMYLVAEAPQAGVRVKLAGEVQLDERTGQVVSTFPDTPQLPFEDLRLHFFGTARAPLSTPALCGSYTTDAAFGPWSATPAAQPSSEFTITSGPNGSPCANPLPFAPALTGGSTSIQAGGFSPFTTTLTREDGNQNLRSVVLHMPPGLSGTLTGVQLCGEAQADAGTCGPASLIGETIVSVGLGGDPFSVRGGKVYLTGPYDGAPFGLSIVNPAKAGPFDLGQVVVRAKVEVNPYTAALTIATDPSGPYAIPQILDGIPLQIKHINVIVNRERFTFNPTDCNPLAITGTLQSSEGSSQALSVPFQVTNCAALSFAPKFVVSTSGRTSRANGASLKVRLAYPSAPAGSQANIARVKVELPKRLPSRLKTLQKACTAAQFEANPAGCPAASIVGHAKATTPILPVPLEGPAYFVSHGGEAFPSLIVVLQGYGVTVDLVGATFISKQGITSSTFKTVPDVPVGAFELTLPEGPYSALAANGGLCGRAAAAKLKMPTTITAQNGAVLKQLTQIAVMGCAKPKRSAHHARKQTKRGRRK